MSADPQDCLTATTRALRLVALAGLVLGITAQLLRQIQGPGMALRAATAPWLTIGFLCALWTTRLSPSLRVTVRLGIATMAVYLAVWLLAYHATFAVRESVGFAAGWREAAPWLVVAMPTSLVLGIAAATANKGGVLGDICLALPIAWSMPEIITNTNQGWSYALVVSLPTALLAVAALLAVGRRNVNLLRVVFACGLFALAGLAFLPVLRNLVHS